MYLTERADGAARAPGLGTPPSAMVNPEKVFCCVKPRPRSSAGSAALLWHADGSVAAERAAQGHAIGLVLLGEAAHGVRGCARHWSYPFCCFLKPPAPMATASTTPLNRALSLLGRGASGDEALVLVHSRGDPIDMRCLLEHLRAVRPLVWVTGSAAEAALRRKIKGARGALSVTFDFYQRLAALPNSDQAQVVERHLRLMVMGRSRVLRLVACFVARLLPQIRALAAAGRPPQGSGAGRRRVNDDVGRDALDRRRSACSTAPP